MKAPPPALDIEALGRLDRPGLAAEDNPAIVDGAPADLPSMREAVEDYLSRRPLGPDTPLAVHKALNFIFEKAARLLREEGASLPGNGPFSREVRRTLARGPENIGPAGYACAVESAEALLDFLEFRSFLYEPFDARPDAARLLSFREESIRFVLDRIPRRPGARILDLGCGYGTIAYHLAARGNEVTGVDYSFSRVEKIAPIIEKLPGRGRVSILWGDATRLPFPDGHFGQIVSADLIEHLGEEEQLLTLAEAARVLRPGGEWFISTPNLAYLRLTTLARKLKAIAGPGGAGERLRRWRAERIPYTPGAAVGHGQHIGLLTAGRLRRLARRAGLPPLRTFRYMRGDIPGRAPRAIRNLLALPPLRSWLSSWFLVSGTASAHAPPPPPPPPPERRAAE
ncbi:MAG: class I SAM-dependent methyltransferase [bacterium]